MCSRAASVAVAVAEWLCVLLAFVSAASEIRIFKKEGDVVILKPRNASITDVIGTVIWMHNLSLAIEFDKTGTDHYRQFKERGSLNLTNGEMTITGLIQNDSGLYTSEINEIKSLHMHLIVLSPVPKPTVGKSCDEASASCTLTCDGDIVGAGLVTHRWRLDNNWTTGSEALHITKDDTVDVSEFSCELENQVSRESSQPIPNPLSTRGTQEDSGGDVKISKGVTVFVGLLLAVLLLVSVHRCKAGMWFFQKPSMPWESDFWKKQNTEIPDQGEIDEESSLAQTARNAAQ